MRGTLVAFLAVLALACSGCAGAAKDIEKAAPAAIQAPPSAARQGIEGYASNDRFETVPGVQVTVEGLGLSATTNKEGYFFLGPLAAGPYRLRATHPAYEPQTLRARVEEGATSLHVFILTGIPGWNEYQVRILQRGFISCAVAVGQPTQAHDTEAGAATQVRCGIPRIGGGSSHNPTDQAPRVDVTDRSHQRWAVDEPSATWTTVRLTTQWYSAHELTRHFLVQFGIDGCMDAARMFGAREGPSPLQQAANRSHVAQVVENAEGTTCGEPGERCDTDHCVLSSRSGPAARSLVGDLLRMGATLQQTFDQELLVTFAPIGAGEGQTLK